MELKRTTALFISMALFFTVLPVFNSKFVKGKFFIGETLGIVLAIVFLAIAGLAFWFDRKDIKLADKKREYILLIIAFILFCTIVNLINNLTDPSRAVFLKLPIDSAIPLLPPLVLFYLFFLWYALATFGYTWYDRKLFSKVILSWVFLMTVSCAIYVAFPTGVIKPPFIPHNILGEWTLLVQNASSQFNALPSLHASGAVLALLTLFHFKKGKIIAPFIMATLASTVMLKQHFIVDIIAGIALGIFVYILFFRINKTPGWNREAFWQNLHAANPWFAKLMNKKKQPIKTS